MDLPGTETPQAAQERRRRRLVLGVVLALVVLAVVGVTESAFAGHDTARVVASSTPAQYPDPAAPASWTTTTAKPVSTTGQVIATTAAPATSPPTTARYVPPPVEATAPPTTRPPVTAAPVVLTASLQVGPAQANFPSLPPPYWPMPIVPVTVTNTGRVTLRSVVVHPVGVYSVPSSTCGTLTPGQSCVAKVQFCPTSPNHYLDTLSVTGEDAATGAPVHASITLNGIAT
jgi:hypothetical protein